MTDMTLQDLAEAADGGGSSGSSDESSGEWALDLYERLAESGRLDRILFGDDGPPTDDEIQREAAEVGEVPPPEEHEGEPPASTSTASDGGSPPITAEQLKQVMLQLYDNSEMIPGLSKDPKLSEMIKLVKSNPEMVDRLLRQYL